MEKKDLIINNLKFTLWTAGNPSSPPLFLVHGFADSGANFHWVSDYLKEHYYCIAPDLRGHGLSEGSKSPLGYFFYEYVADLYEMINHFSPEKPVFIVGHSMGGNIVSLYGGACPERIKAFVNIEGLGIKSRSLDKAPQNFSHWLQKKMNPARLNYKTLENFSSHLQKRNPLLPEERALLIAKNLLRQNDDNSWSLRVDPLHFLPNPYIYRFENVAPFFEKHQGKILFIQSEHTNMADWIVENRSEETQKELSKEVLKRLNHYPNYQIKNMDNCGHMIHYDKPQELAEEIFSFFKEV